MPVYMQRQTEDIPMVVQAVFNINQLARSELEACGHEQEASASSRPAAAKG